MSYIEKNLMQGEDILLHTRFSKWTMVPYIVFGLLLTAVFGLGLLLIAYGFFAWKKSEVAITNKRISKRTGVFFTSTQEIKREKVESIIIKESLFQWGNVIVSGTGSQKMNFIVDEINSFRKIVQEISN